MLEPRDVLNEDEQTEDDNGFGLFLKLFFIFVMLVVYMYLK